MKTFALVLAGLTIAAAAPASASVITTLPGGVSQFMPVTQSFTAGPVTFGDITYTSDNSWSVVGYNAGYGFGGNPSWFGGAAMVGLNAYTGSMTLTLASPVSAILADLNWAPGYSMGQLVTMSVYNSANQLLESFTLADANSNLVKPGYYGFQRNQGDIAKLVLSNGYIGGRDFSTVAGGAVPEPATWSLMIAGFGLAGASLRRRRAVAA